MKQQKSQLRDRLWTLFRWTALILVAYGVIFLIFIGVNRPNRGTPLLSSSVSAPPVAHLAPNSVRFVEEKEVLNLLTNFRP